MDKLLQQLITDVNKECAQQKISVRQFLIGLGESSTNAWYSLAYDKFPSYGKLQLLLKLLKYFNYDKKPTNSL